jgi:uracil-DNA glycosylase family 4
MSPIPPLVAPPPTAGEETSNGKPESCKTCPLYHAPGIVWGAGNRTAKMMLVGEAPGEEEAANLRPFVGGSGRILNALLVHAQIDRSQCFVTNVVKCRPTSRSVTGRVTNRTPTETEIRHCARFLKHELDIVNPNIVVALGNVPMQTLTDAKRGISIVRSVPTPGPKRPVVKTNIEDANTVDAIIAAVDNRLPERYKVIGTMHPSFVMRTQDIWPAVVFDLARANAESATPAIVRREWKPVIHARLSDVGDGLLRRIKELKRYHHDLETTGLNFKKDTVRCFGVAAEPSHVFVFDWTGNVQDFVRDLHADPTLCCVGQNSELFDIPFQEEKGFVFNGPTFDTMLGFHQLNSSLPKDLAFIGACYTDEMYWKDETMYKAGEDALQLGCAKDVHATARAYEEQHKEMAQIGQQQLDLYYKQIMPLQPVLRSMSRRGLKINSRDAAAWHVVLNRRADEAEAKLKRGLGDSSFDINSPKQLMDLLYRRMGLPVQYKDDKEKGSRPTVDAEALDKLAEISDNPILKLIRVIRTLRKFDATYVMCERDENDFIHPKFGTAKARTGRLNSFDPNAQNWPVDLRVLATPDHKDAVLVSRDWSQIEWRLAMVLSGDTKGLDALAAGRDAHQDAYAEAFSTPYDKVTKMEREIAKGLNYGLLYGRGVESIVAGRNVGRATTQDSALPLDVAQAYVKGFFAKYNRFDGWRKWLVDKVKRDHYAESAWGRRRYWYTQQVTEVYNHPIQSTAASMMYIALIQLERELATISPDVTLRLTVHDETVTHSPKDQRILSQVVECTRTIMEQVFTEITEASRYPETVKKYYPGGWWCPTDCTFGETWKQCKPGSKEEKAEQKELQKRLGVAA